MKRTKASLLAIFLLAGIPDLPAQGDSLRQKPGFPDSTALKVFELPEFFVTATRTHRRDEEIPARINAITEADARILPANTTDDLLTFIPGMNVDRTNGIFSKNASVTMRGLNGSARTLVMIDGVPLNKTDGGGINWNMIVPESIDRIEILKGPVSAVYGSNAMAGAINIITKKPVDRLELTCKAFYGTFNTMGGVLKIGGSTRPYGNAFYYGLSGFYRRGDGYIIVPGEIRDSLDVRNSMWEWTVSGNAGVRYGSGSYTEAAYSYYDDKRNDGFRVFEPEGGLSKYTTNSVRVTSYNNLGRVNLVVNAFYQDEHYFRQNESLSAKKGNKYTLYHTDASRIDAGLWTNLTYHILKEMAVTGGLDYKSGRVDGRDIYYTSTDVLHNQGRMDFYAFFAEYEWKILKERLILLAGLRYDIATFRQGRFTIEDPTTLTAFMTEYPTVFSNETWDALSPKIGLKYRFTGNHAVYISYSRGFRPPMLDDMCKNGNVTKGFKLANPQLKPETVDNIEAGASVMLWNRIIAEPSLYYTTGNHFQYFVNTGDSIYTGGDNLKPIMRRENVSRVRVLGTELMIRGRIAGNIFFSANYAFNDSRISEFDTAGQSGKDLTGKFLMEVPRNQFFAGVWWNNRYVVPTLIFNYKDAQWADDENTYKTPAYWTMDLKLTSIFFQKLAVSLVVQDIFDRRYEDSKGNLSPGRFFMLNLDFRLPSQ